MATGAGRAESWKKDGAREETGCAPPASTFAFWAIRGFVTDEVIVIRRLTDRHRAYTGIFLPGEPPRIFPTSDAEHGRILQIYKQDRPHEGIINDFSEFAIGRDEVLPARDGRAEDTGAPGPATTG